VATMGAPLERRQWLPPAWFRDLSAREREVAALVAYGFSDANIAAQLDISEATIGTHLAKVFRKLNVHSRVQLTRKLTDR
jgi:DNA-binding NarL/FixJ family response regulator